MPLWLVPILGKYALHLGVAAGLLVTGVMWDRSRVAVGVQKERASVERKGEVIDAKARRARADIERGDARRVLDKWYRD
jgi:hypothetical protein